MTPSSNQTHRKTILNPNVMQKLQEKGEQVKKTLTPEEGEMLQSAIDQFCTGAITVNQLTNVHASIRQRYRLPIAQPELDRRNAITDDLTEEEKELLKTMKLMSPKERIEYVKNSARAVHVLQKLQRMKVNSERLVKQEVSESSGNTELPNISFQQLGSILDSEGLNQNVGDTLNSFISSAVQDKMSTILEEFLLNLKLDTTDPKN